MGFSLWDYLPVSRADIARQVEAEVESRVEDYLNRFVGAQLATTEGRLAALSARLVAIDGQHGRLNSLIYEHTLLGERLNTLEDDQYHLGERMTSMEDAAWARVGELVGLIKAEFASLRDQIDAAVADKDAAVAAGVASALADDATADTARVSGLISELESVLPAPVPAVVVPEPGQPAELPPAE